MQSVRIIPVTTSAQRRLFVDLPMQLHRLDPRFVPGLAFDECRLLGFKKGHPFPEENEVQAWLAMRGNQPLGRMATISVHDRLAHFNQNCAHFGFFAVENDLQATRSMLRQAAAWAKQRGLETLLGPFSPSINYSVGLLHDGFEFDPSFQIPYNPSYYSSLLEASGMQPAQDLYALELSREQLLTVTPRLERVAERLSQRHRVTFRQLNPRRMRQDLTSFLSIAQRSLRDHWGFLPLSERETQHLVKDMSWIVDPKMLHFAQVDGVDVGGALALPDLAQCLRKIQGRLLPLGFARLWLTKRKAKGFRVVATNILPEFSRLGLAPALISRIARNALNSSANRLEFSWIAESNPLSFGTIENGGARKSKVLRVFQASCQQLLENVDDPPAS